MLDNKKINNISSIIKVRASAIQKSSTNLVRRAIHDIECLTTDLCISELIGNKKTVLIIDDDDTTAEYIKINILRHFNKIINEIYIAHDSWEALAILKMKKYNIDIISTDVYHPGSDGVVIAKNIINKFPKIKIIIFSGNLEGIRRASLVTENVLMKPADWSDYNKIFKKLIDDTIEMLLIKGGTFQMGDSFGDGESIERPIHLVTVSDFYIGKTEVTVAQYRAFCIATGRAMPSAPPWGWHNDHPVVKISWNEAKAFCDWIGCRLPTEAEWEYAAKGGNKSQGYKYSGSNTVDDVAWYSRNSTNSTHSVGTKKANELGLYDMSGNVWEWCIDWHDSEYYNNSTNMNPQSPSIGSLPRVIRGGSWCEDPWFARCSLRGSSGNIPISRNNDNGFRCAR